MAEILGIDVGGTGIKAAIVDTETGKFLTKKVKYGTPKPSKPESVMDVINQLIDDMDWRGKPYGVGFPSIIKDHICYSAANIDKGWIGLNLSKFFKKHTGSDITIMNDADAAALAEMTHGIGKGRKGTVILITLGTGIGSGIFLNGELLPNSEFGHLLYKKSVFEHYASNGARKRGDLSWKDWGKEVNTYLNHVNLLICPDLIILGGGVSKYYDEKFSQYIDVDTEVVHAAMGNEAGITGAAMACQRAGLMKGY